MGANPDLVDNNQQTPLYYAIKSGRIEICELLLKNGAKVVTSDKKGITPISFAKRFNRQ